MDNLLCFIGFGIAIISIGVAYRIINDEGPLIINNNTRTTIVNRPKVEDKDK